MPLSERYRSIDIVRALALFGVLIVNVLTLFRVPLLEHILSPETDPGLANQSVDFIVAGALEFKALTIFSFLFGVGIAIQMERAKSRKVSGRRFLLRRLSWLFALGTAHLLLVWNGDILALYAICGLLLLPLLTLPWPALFIVGAAAIVLPQFVPFGLGLPSGHAAEALIAQARQVYPHGSYREILQFRWHETGSLIVPLLIAILPRTLGLMCWGCAAWRSGIVQEPHRHQRKFVAAIVLGAAAGVPITANQLWATSSGSVYSSMMRAASFAGPILLALAYISGVMLWVTSRGAPQLSGLAACGQMALTNYLVQSIVFGFVFYGYGLGLFGRVGSARAACIGLVVYVAQVRLSRLWLTRFRFGPFEWLWRSLAYGQRQPLLRFTHLSRQSIRGES